MIVLGIESSCDETAASVVMDGREVRSSVVASQYELHEEFGGVVPEIASRAHEQHILPVVRDAIAQAGIEQSEIDLIAVGHRPGLIGSLLVGLSAAKAMSWSLGVPMVGVDHVHAHLYAGMLGREEPQYPALGLVISGGHTSIYEVRSALKVKRLGSTIDDAIGEAFDKVAAILGLGHPGGPKLDALAAEPGANDRAFDFPVSRLSKDSLDFSYSGLKTAVLYEAKGKPAPPALRGKPPLPKPEVPELTHERMRDIAASFQRAAVRALTIKLGRAIERVEGCRTLIVGGGVSANSLARREMQRFCDEHGLELIIPQMGYCVDNAAMIAGLGDRLHASGQVDDLNLSAVPTTGC
ncbi:MAG: tRNA (adenosine(37)-N6)-threonylcarbamoyltransferase complex transferase subunit TsaD [Phycisphaerae bacterium]|nr:tRNA (adenosine(37)-N6)-threonylcarbamoyltransferase complex transferase subunit TsaD [Phycisphaerae bacterium]MBM91909.1 tRNA (adenosine(37)-N6)-threonylcarbamoyltransferase complex transferase subunit TsaD [Phycisphaerae bacterium]